MIRNNIYSLLSRAFSHNLREKSLFCLSGYVLNLVLSETRVACFYQWELSCRVIIQSSTRAELTFPDLPTFQTFPALAAGRMLRQSIFSRVSHQLLAFGLHSRHVWSCTEFILSRTWRQLQDFSRSLLVSDYINNSFQCSDICPRRSVREASSVTRA